MPYLALTAYCLLLAYLAWRNFRSALFIFILLLPGYLIRFTIVGLPTTLLEVSFGIIFLVWLIKYARADWPKIKQFFSANKFFAASLAVFFLASISGIFVSDMWWYSLGQWRAYFLEPMLFCLVLIGRLAPPPNKEESGEMSKNIVAALLTSTIPLSIVAIIQSLSGNLYPPSLWDDITRGRAVGYFTSPNALALYLVPILMLSLSLLKNFKQTNQKKYFFLTLFAFILGCAALIFSQSYGGAIALVAGLSVWFFLNSKNRPKIFKHLLVYALVIIAISFLGLNNSALRAKFSTKIRSGNNRLLLWSHTATFLTATPKNFIFGAGIRQYFRKIEKPLYNPAELERLIYPHNILLNFWSEIGLLGATAFLLLLFTLLQYSWRAANKQNIFAAALCAGLIAILIHGLIDVPYFKNDLAFLFWIIAGLVIASKNNVVNIPERV